MTDKHFHLLLSYTWEYDKEFAERVNKIFQMNNLQLLVFNEKSIHEIVSLIRDRNYTINAYLDRASDVDENFNIVTQLLKDRDTYLINPLELSEVVVNKANMLPRVLASGLRTPQTFLLPPYDEHPDITFNDNDLNEIGRPFIIKPCYYTGGGDGVITDAMNLEEVFEARKIYSDDNYLVQKKIYPAFINGKRAWYRIIWAFGRIIISQWDDLQHIYSDDPHDLPNENLQNEMKLIANKIAELCKLDYFSTEVVLTDSNELYVIDYVNDQIDMRLKSNHHDGVPESIVDEFIQSMIDKIIMS